MTSASNTQEFQTLVTKVLQDHKMRVTRRSLETSFIKVDDFPIALPCFAGDGKAFLGHTVALQPALLEDLSPQAILERVNNSLSLWRARQEAIQREFEARVEFEAPYLNLLTELQAEAVVDEDGVTIEVKSKDLDQIRRVITYLKSEGLL